MCSSDLIFPYWSGQFFGTRTDSTFCRYSPGLNNFLVLTLILQFFRTGPDSFSALARIPPFANTRLDSTMFRYSHSFCHFSVLVWTVFRYSHGIHRFRVLDRIQQFFGTHTDSTIFPYWSGQFFGTRTTPPFAYTGPDSTIFRHSH